MKRSLMIGAMCFFSVGISQAQGIIVNEISQGPTGQKEFIELLVVGSESQTTGTVDISDWIIDDNNGAFETATNSTIGVATGHFRFTSNDTTQNMPIGALIVIYNVADKNANWDFIELDGDGNDIAHIEDAGMTYYIPGTSTLLRACSGLPSMISESYEYTSSAIPPTSANWSGQIGLANGGDAIQVRQPDGTFYHGFGFSTPTLTDTFTVFPVFMEGALSAFNTNKGTGAAKVTYLNCGSWYFTGNYQTGAATADIGTTAETPGQANNADNEDLIASVASGAFNYAELTSNLPCPEILPVTLVSFTAYLNDNNIVELGWTTAGEKNNDYFLVEKSRDQKQWAAAGRVKGAGNTAGITSYKLIDDKPYEGTSFYRLVQVDFDGRKAISGIAMIGNAAPGEQLLVYPNPVNGLLTIDGKYGNTINKVVIHDVTGRVVYQQGNPVMPLHIRTDAWNSGSYFISVQQATEVTNLRVVKQ